MSSFFSKVSKFLEAPAQEFVMDSLSNEERVEFDRACQVVRAGLRSFLDAGEALLKIKEKQLYREKFATFESFAVTEFNLTGRRCDQLIESYRIVQSLKLVSESLPTPTVEAVVRPLANMPADLQLEAYEEAVEAAGGQVPTPKQVKAAAAKRKAAPKSKAPKPTRFRVPGAIVEVTPNKAFGGVVEALEAALNQARQAAGKREAA